MTLERQLELEEKMLSLGEEKYRDGLDAENDFDSAHVQKIVKKMVEPFALAIKNEIDWELEQPRNGGPKPPLVKLNAKNVFINSRQKDTTINAMQLSFIVIRTIFICLRDGKRRMVACSSDVGKAINHNIIHDEKYKPQEEIRIGAILINLLIRNYHDWFETEIDENGIHNAPFTFFDKESKNKEYVVSPSEKFIDFCDEVIDGIAAISTIIYPMIHVPVDWDSHGKDGGFYSEQLKRNIIKRKSINESSGIDPAFAKIINGVQQTPWKVNDITLSVIGQLNSRRIKPQSYEKAFPAKVDKDPPRPLDKELKYSDMDDEQKKLHQTWSRQTAKLKKKRQAKKSIDLSREASIIQGNMFKNEEEIFFPHDLDYRNRLYNMCMTGLNTQGNDIQKGLIQLANPRQVKTESGIKWLKINMANLVGHDKLVLDKRVEWVNNNEQLLRDVVKDPLKCELWHKWDKPLQGLAAAVDYVKWLDNDQAFLNTHIQLDGLC